MPSSSRKRNKGKDRKAKQKAKENTDKVMALTYCLWTAQLKAGCDHGCATIIPDLGHPVSKFMNEFYMRLSVMNNILPLLKKAFETYPQVFHNESYRKMLLDILVRMNTNVLMGQSENGENIQVAVSMSATILVLEEYDKTNDFDAALVGCAITSKRRHLTIGISSNERDILKFYRKRVSCKCLKRMHLDSRKATPKMARCFNCNVEKERASLSVCSRCMITEYCSRECQVANWYKHVSDCDEYVRAADVC